jgi:GNAT superfamily N-acetyltransferase
MSAIRYSIAPFGPDIMDAYARLFPEYAAEKTPELLSWRIERGPHGPGRFAIARDGAGGKIIGILGMVPTRLRVGAEVHPAHQAIDLVVDPAFRGRGVFTGLGQALQDSAAEDGRILWGFPNANAAHAWFGRFGWHRFGSAPFMVRPLRSGYLLRKALPVLGGLDFPLVRRRRRASSTKREIERFGDDVDGLWSASRAPDGIAVDRDAAWLNWRLMDKPDAPYRSVGAYDQKGVLEGFVSTCLLDKHGGRICYVMEAMAPPEKAASLSELMRGEVARAAGEGAEVALAWCPPAAPNRAAYRRAGFLPLPDRLRPIEMHFGARALVAEAAAAVSDGSKWFVSYLDSDTV